MSLYAQLQRRHADGKPIRIGLIGAGKFGSMYLAQVPRTPGVQLVGIADLSPDAARRNLARVGWADEQTRAASLDAAIVATGTRLFYPAASSPFDREPLRCDALIASPGLQPRCYVWPGVRPGRACY